MHILNLIIDDSSLKLLKFSIDFKEQKNLSNFIPNFIANFLFKKQPGQNIIAKLKKDNQKLFQLIQNMNQSNGTTTNSTTIPTCEKNCTKGMI